MQRNQIKDQALDAHTILSFGLFMGFVVKKKNIEYHQTSLLTWVEICAHCNNQSDWSAVPVITWWVDQTSWSFEGVQRCLTKNTPNMLDCSFKEKWKILPNKTNKQTKKKQINIWVYPPLRLWCDPRLVRNWLHSCRTTTTRKNKSIKVFPSLFSLCTIMRLFELILM